MNDRRKRSHNFAITLNHVEWDKSCFGEFMIAGGNVKRLAVGEEQYHPPLDWSSGEAVEVSGGGVHHHIFVEFIDGFYLSDVREMVVEFLDNGKKIFFFL